MRNDHALIDEWVWTQPRALIATDVEAVVDTALSNGCYFISAPHVQAQAQELARWSEAQLLERLRQLDSAV